MPTPASTAWPRRDRLPDLAAQLELVRRIALGLARHLPQHIDVDELIALGNLGLVEARRRFDASRGVPFQAYASGRIRGAMIDWLRQLDPLSREGRARARQGERSVEGVTLDEAGDPPADGTPADEVVGCRQAFENALARLPARARHLVERHVFDGLPLKRVGAEIGVGEARASQVLGEALARIAEARIADEGGAPSLPRRRPAAAAAPAALRPRAAARAAAATPPRLRKIA